jgi:hypothetical protein
VFVGHEWVVPESVAFCWVVYNVTASEYCGIAPMNQADCAQSVVPVLAITGRPGHAADGYPVAPTEAYVEVLSNDRA